MTWVKLDDAFFRNAKMRAAGKDGRALYIAGLCHCAAQLTDGLIDKAMLPVLAAEAEVKPSVALKLVETGVWLDEGAYYRVHDYLGWNPSAEHVRAKRAARAEAGRRGGKQSGQSRRTKPEANSEAIASANGKQNRTNHEPRSRTHTDVDSGSELTGAVREGWRPTETSLEWAYSQGYSHFQVRRQTERFVAKNAAGCLVDPNAAWRNWIAREEPEQANVDMPVALQEIERIAL